MARASSQSARPEPGPIRPTASLREGFAYAEAFGYGGEGAQFAGLQGATGWTMRLWRSGLVGLSSLLVSPATRRRLGRQ